MITAPASFVENLGEFTVLALLGEGGSGTVYRARWGHREVALKVMRAELPSSERDRFLTEARLLMEITHPGVVKVLAAGALPDDRPYLAMEILPGETLAARLAQAPLPLRDAVALFAQLADAVAAMHAHGLLHRDLKPENVMLVSDGEREHAVLLDFGIARAMDAGIVAPTQTGIVRGTPAYMAPERFFGQPATIATDVYELAVTLFAMISGRLPWTDCIDPEVRLNPARLIDTADVPEALDAEVARALSTRAGNRPAGALALRDAVLAATGAAGAPGRQTASVAPLALARTVAKPALAAGTPGPASVRIAAPPSSMPTWASGGQAAVTTGNAAGERRSSDVTPARRRRWPWLLGLAVVAGAATTIPLVWSRGDHPPSATVPSTVADADDPWAQPGPSSLSPARPDGPATEVTALTAAEVTAIRDELGAAADHHADDVRSVLGLAAAEVRGDPGLAPALAAAAGSSTVTVMTAMLVGRCRFDLVGRARWLLLGVTADGDFDLTARGAWTRDEIERCLMTGRDGEVRRVAAAGLPRADQGGPITLVPLDGKGGSRFQAVGWIDDQTFVATTRSRGDAGFIAARLARAHAAQGPSVATGLAALDRAATAWVVATRAGFDAVVETPTLRGAEMTARIALAADGVNFDFKLGYQDAAAATAAHAFIDRQFAGLAGDGMLGLALPGFAIERDGRRVTVRGRLPTSMIGSLRDQLITAMP